MDKTNKLRSGASTPLLLLWYNDQKISETFYILIRLISEKLKKHLSERSESMDNGASSYRRFLDGDDNGLAEIVRDYSDGLILYLNGIVNNIAVSEDLM